MTHESGPITTLESMPSDPDDIRGWLGTLSDEQLKSVWVASALTLGVEGGMEMRGVHPLRLLLTEVSERFCATEARLEKPRRQRECRRCGSEFSPMTSTQVYCSRSCAVTLHELTCPGCGSEFKAPSRNQKFCGRKCAARNRGRLVEVAA